LKSSVFYVKKLFDKVNIINDVNILCSYYIVIQAIFAMGETCKAFWKIALLSFHYCYVCKRCQCYNNKLEGMGYIFSPDACF